MKIIISEKEEAGRRIAETLIPGFEEVKEQIGPSKVTYFKKDGTLVVPASGHIYGYSIKGLRSVKTLEQLPITDYYITEDNKPRVALFKKLLVDNPEVIAAADWDREGEVIGYNIVANIMGIKDPKKIQRAYYSALRAEDIKSAFSHIKPINEELLTQGLARNLSDLIIGLNLTKALTLVFKKEQKELGQAISLGRVQSPLLGYIGDTVGITITDEVTSKEVEHKTARYFVDLGKAQYPLNFPENEPPLGTVKFIGKGELEKEEKQAEDLLSTDDVMARSRLNPETTMEVMEALYLQGYMTYPRTTSRYVRNVNFLQEIEDAIRKGNTDFSETFSYTNTPAHRVEEAHPDAVLLTPEGVEAYYKGKLKGRQEFIAKFILNSIMRAFAPPLKRKIQTLTMEWDAKTENGTVTKSKTYEWCTEYTNPEDAISKVSNEERVFPELQKKYLLIKLVDLVSSEEFYPIYNSTVRIIGDIELVQWMYLNQIGTEATRQIYPGLMKDKNYVDQNNLPTTLGAIVSKIISHDIGLTPELTAKMEGRINDLSKMNELDSFIGEVVVYTKEFINKLKDVKAPTFTCPSGHSASLVNRFNKMTGKTVLLLQCKECGKYYGL